MQKYSTKITVTTDLLAAALQIRWLAALGSGQQQLYSHAALHSCFKTNRKASYLTSKADNFNKSDKLTESDSGALQWVGKATANKEKRKSDLERALFLRNPDQYTVAIFQDWFVCF